ncbi:type IV secretory system conjugative DNA transfer family protein [Ktedonospora formicarum]|uniref:TraD/TraG TraM recognition site domain-containing protein n=1 Tax=Ktedonospora formicarum TaxID=2778364 RepID=A0A8J3IB96_9CHLR|nr:type IV secretory system conjugative DNA transfer family protein [Ktedonospora formicarum]GHO50836.1 hypothetical protein KSX_89990 [Ktedonospora formicarum]
MEHTAALSSRDQRTEQTHVAPDGELVTPPLGAQYLLLITPSDEEERQASAMENFFQACASDEPFAVELVGTRREQGFVLRASSAEQLLLLSKQFSAQYPQADLSRIAPEADPLLLREGEHAVIGEFAMTHKPWMPLKTFSGRELLEPGADPLAGILAAMEPLGSGQRLIAQLALLRAPEHWIDRYIRKSVEHPLQGERDARLTGARVPSSGTNEMQKTLLLVAALFGALLAYRCYITQAWIQLILLLGAALVLGIALLWWTSTHARQEIYDMQLVTEKLSRQAFYTSLRVIAIGQQSTSTKEQLQRHITRLAVAYRQFTVPSANSLALKRVRSIQTKQTRARQLVHPHTAFPYAHPLLRVLYGGVPGPDIWNGLELSGAFHLPQAFTDLPLVRRVSLKQLLASPEIARQMEQARAPLPPAFIGYSRHRGYSVPVYLPYATLFSHKFLVARSRYGKSTLMQLLIQAAMQEVQDHTLQPGVFVIDPHKDLIEDLLKLIPAQRVKDVVLLDLTDTDAVPALNPLDATMGFTRDQAVANLLASFERVWSDFWGPRMAYFLKAVCLLLYTLNQQRVRHGKADQQYTLLDINPLLQYRDYAIQVLQELDMRETWHQELFAWWVNVYFALPPQSSFRNEVIMPIVSKLGVFHDNQQMRRIVGQPITKAPVHVAITEGKIVLCALSSRDMDDASVNILGSTLINLLHRAFHVQQDVPLPQRRQVLCAADEFHALAGGDWDRLLSEDAKFGCSLLLATQNLKRLNKIRDGLLEMVFSNCDNMFAFNVSAADAKLLEEEFRGVIEAKDILSQPRLHSYARLCLPKHPVQIVSVTLTPPASWAHTPSQAQQVATIRQQHQQQNTSAADIDSHYADHLAQFLDITPLAQKLQRDARDLKAAQTSKQQRAHAEQLAADVQVIRQQPQAPHWQQAQTSSPADQFPKNREHDGTPASIRSSLAGGSGKGAATTPDQEEEHIDTPGDGKRNHPRSKRKKQAKEPVGVAPPFPLLPSDPEQEPNTSQPRFPMRSAGGALSWRSERERGE